MYILKKYYSFSFLNSHLLRKSFFLILFVSTFIRVNAQDKKDKIRIDSIFSAISSMKEDTQTVNYIIIVYKDYLWQFNLPESYSKLKYAGNLSVKLNYLNGEYLAYGNMSGYCVRVGMNDFALENRKKSLKIAEQQNDSSKIASCWSGIGLAYRGLGKNDSAIIYFKKALPLTEKTGNRDNIARIYLFLGWTYQAMGEDSLALRYALNGLELRKEINYSDGIMSSSGSVRSIYLGLKNYEKAMEHSRIMLAISETAKNKSDISNSLLNIGEVYEKQNKIDSALINYNKALEIILEINNKNLLRDAYSHLASAMELKGELTQSYDYYKKFIHLKDSLSNAEMTIVNERTKEIYDLESKNAEIELKGKDIEAQKKFLIGLGLILGISCILGVIIFMGYRQKKRMAIDLSIQKQVVEEKNLDITNSIVYAKRIQQAILPSLDEIKKALPDSFVLYHPKDIVSGDFFWFTETTDSFYIAAVDCTGHGVPGALMSMIGFNFLGQIVNEMKVADTAEILNTLHRKILFALNKDFISHEVKDGMDIALLRIFKNKNEIEFSGAVRPLYIVENGNLNLIKGDIFSIGGIKDANAESFSSHRQSVNKETCLYLFSDGFADQFGGPHGKKFKYKLLKEFFVSNYTLPMEEQKNKLNETFQNWKGNLEQVDDVLVIGVKF
ncbi:hypothetical protein BH09BAC5_BH09BAC5_03710 [soil metagenome]